MSCGFLLVNSLGFECRSKLQSIGSIEVEHTIKQESYHIDHLCRIERKAFDTVATRFSRVRKIKEDNVDWIKKR